MHCHVTHMAKFLIYLFIYFLLKRLCLQQLNISLNDFRMCGINMWEEIHFKTHSSCSGCGGYHNSSVILDPMTVFNLLPRILKLEGIG